MFRLFGRGRSGVFWCEIGGYIHDLYPNDSNRRSIYLSIREQRSTFWVTAMPWRAAWRNNLKWATMLALFQRCCLHSLRMREADFGHSGSEEWSFVLKCCWMLGCDRMCPAAGNAVCFRYIFFPFSFFREFWVFAFYLEKSTLKVVTGNVVGLTHFWRQWIWLRNFQICGSYSWEEIIWLEDWELNCSGQRRKGLGKINSA